ncbi:transposase [Janthinobacterium sp. LB3P112]|uniref:transposase n=1 Tax=Janthinobacterium sp. LB3P112 TaxID=3424196 RepID=UPI003F2930C6
MTRPLRLEFAGALYHVTSRGDRRGAIYRDDTDRLAWQEVLELVCERHHFVVHSFCQMSNHYHLLVETVEANLSQGMRQLNGVYTQHFNRRHKLAGWGSGPPFRHDLSHINVQTSAQSQRQCT